MTEDEGDDTTADPATKKKKDGSRVHIRVTQERHQRWKASASKEECDLSRFVRLAVEDYIERYSERKPKKKKRRRPKRR